MLNLFNFVQFAYAWHSSSKLVSALAQSQISASHREPFLPFLRGQILKRVQDDGAWVVMGVCWPQVLGCVAVPRLCRRHFLFFVFCFHGLKSPRLLAFGFASFRRQVCFLSFPRTCSLGLSTFGFAPFQTPCLLLCCNVMLNLFNFVQFAYAWHSSSKLASALAQSQISASHREPFLVFLRLQILKRVIRIRSSKTSFIFLNEVWSG